MRQRDGSGAETLILFAINKRNTGKKRTNFFSQTICKHLRIKSFRSIYTDADTALQFTPLLDIVFMHAHS